MLIQFDCQTGCGPHAQCVDCASLSCEHVQTFLIGQGDVATAIAALPTAEAAIQQLVAEYGRP
jgi:hypothetical protein